MKKSKRLKINNLREENNKLLSAIYLKCAECCGYFDKGYFNCASNLCPLNSYFPTIKQYQSLIRTQSCQEEKNKALLRS